MGQNILMAMLELSSLYRIILGSIVLMAPPFVLRLQVLAPVLR